jgi:peptidoglycan/xylan/chitin deacetylase (PgdA/CDA1 family)/SAM-dependent methyltransferase
MSERVEEKDHWNALFSREDPWDYSSAYEQQKYRHTLDMLPEEPFARTLELGCAEGLFTEMLSKYAGEVLAMDISERALERATARCAGQKNVTFVQHDIAQGLNVGDFDLIVCSEILYYLRDRYALAAFAGQVKQALRPGGYLLMTHANMVSDDKTQTGFDFNAIGAKFIGETFSSEQGLEFVRELRTDLYRVQLFRRSQISDRPLSLSEARIPQPPREVTLRDVDFEHTTIKRGGCVVTAAEARHCWVSARVPFLMYHRVAVDGPEALSPYRVSPVRFEQQLAYLQRHGYRSLSMGDFYESWFKRGLQPMPGKPIVLTFDDAYLDFYETAWPLLRKYGFTATIFVPVNFVEGQADWDSEYGEPAKLMNWEQIAELHTQGVGVGSHGCSHTMLPELSDSEVSEDAKRSKDILEQKLAAPVTDYCYPYTVSNNKIQQLIAAAGYQSAVGGKMRETPDWQNPFNIPRIEIFASDSTDDFIRKLPAASPAPVADRMNFYRLRAARDRVTYMDR